MTNFTFLPTRIHEADVTGSIVLHDTYGYTTVSLDELRSSDLDRCLYPEPSEEYIHTIKFMEQIKKDLESICNYATFYNGDSGDETKSLPLIFETIPYIEHTQFHRDIQAMGAGSGGWPTNSNDWAKVYQKAFPEAPTGQQEPVQQDPKDMAVKAETEEDRERLWQAVMDYGKGG